MYIVIHTIGCLLKVKEENLMAGKGWEWEDFLCALSEGNFLCPIFISMATEGPLLRAVHPNICASDTQEMVVSSPWGK